MCVHIFLCIQCVCVCVSTNFQGGGGKKFQAPKNNENRSFHTENKGIVP